MRKEFTSVIYWTSTESSIKRCTCVNKRKNSGSRWTLNDNITRAQTVSVSWGQDASMRASGRQRALGPQWPTVKQPQSRWERSAAMVRRTLGQYSSLSPFPAHLLHTTKITLSRIKCERWYLYREVCSFVHWSSSLCLIIFPHVLCICMWLYNSSIISCIWSIIFTTFQSIVLRQLLWVQLRRLHGTSNRTLYSIHRCRFI